MLGAGESAKAEFRDVSVGLARGVAEDDTTAGFPRFEVVVSRNFVTFRLCQ